MSRHHAIYSFIRQTCVFIITKIEDVSCLFSACVSWVLVIGITEIRLTRNSEISLPILSCLMWLWKSWLYRIQPEDLFKNPTEWHISRMRVSILQNNSCVTERQEWRSVTVYRTVQSRPVTKLVDNLVAFIVVLLSSSFGVGDEHEVRIKFSI